MSSNQATQGWQTGFEGCTGDDCVVVERMPGWSRVLWFVSIASGQLYVFHSGSVQPFDVALLMVSFLTLVGSAQASRVLSQPVTLWLTAFALVTWMVNTVWAGSLAEYGMLVHPLYVTFNLMVFAGSCVAVARWSSQFLKVVAWGCVVSVAVSLVAGVVAPNMGGAVRTTLFFNNPNQMAAHCLATATILFVLRGQLGRWYWTAWAALPTYLWLMTLTGSRAGILSMLLLIILSVAGSRAMLLGAVLAPVLVATFIYMEMEAPHGLELESQATQVFAGRELELAGAYEERGYDRLFRFPEHLVLGAGDGAYWRFGSAIEVHSSLGTVAFCYGIGGLATFLGFMATWAWNNGRRSIFLLPMLAYGLTHQGLRQRTFWVLLALTQGVTWLVAAMSQREVSVAAPTRASRSQRPFPPARSSGISLADERSTS